METTAIATAAPAPVDADPWHDESAAYADAPKVLRRLARGRSVFLSVQQQPLSPTDPTKVCTVSGNARVTVAAAHEFIASAYEWQAKNRGLRVHFSYSRRCLFIGSYGR